MPDEQPKPDSFKLIRARLSFPDIWKPKAVKEGDEPKYAAAFLLDKEEHKDLITLIKTAMWRLAVEHFGGSDKAKELVKKKKLHFALHEGSEKDYDGYSDDNMYLTASSQKRPHVIDRDKSPLTEADRKPYAGCFVNAAVRFWVQDNNFGKRVNCELLAIQFVTDGEAFGAPPFNVDEEFEDLDAGKGGGGKKPAKEKAAPDGAGGASAPDDDEIPF